MSYPCPLYVQFLFAADTSASTPTPAGMPAPIPLVQTKSAPAVDRQGHVSHAHSSKASTGSDDDRSMDTGSDSDASDSTYDRYGGL